MGGFFSSEATEDVGKHEHLILVLLSLQCYSGRLGSRITSCYRRLRLVAFTLPHLMKKTICIAFYLFFKVHALDWQMYLSFFLLLARTK
jgi:hypothetical protein